MASLTMCHSSITALSTASPVHTLQTTPMSGLATCVGYQQPTAGHVPHTAHHGAGGRDWDTGGGGTVVTTPSGLCSQSMSSHLSDCTSSVNTTLEKGGLMLN